MSLTEAIQAYMNRKKKVTPEELQAFIEGWTAKDVAIDIQTIKN